MRTLDLRSFLVGIGIGLMPLIIILAWPSRAPARLSPQDAALYDLCLTQNGSQVSCDAYMRIMLRARTAKAATTVSASTPP